MSVRHALIMGSGTALAALSLALLVSVSPAQADYVCGPEEIVGGVDDYDDFGVSIDVDGSGKAWAVWSGYDPVEGDSEIMFSTNTGSGWSEPARLHGENGSSDRYPVISIGSDNVPWVVWYRAQANGERLWYSRWLDGSWTTPEVLRVGAERYDEYDVIAVDSDDVWLATDTHVSEMRTRVVLMYHWDGAEWSEPWSLDSPDLEASYHPDMALDPSGNPWVVWTGVSVGGVLWPIMFSRWTGSGWAMPDTANADPNNIPGSQIVFDGAVPMVLWDGNGAGTVDVEYSRLEDGEWTSSSLVNLPDSSYADFDIIGACEEGPSGDIVAVWSAGNDHETFSGNIYAAEWTGTGWTAEQEVSGDAPRKIDKYPDAALSADGTLWTAWVCYEEIVAPWDDDIRSTSCVLTTPVDFGFVSAESSTSEIAVSWYAGGAASRGPFFVWRAEASDSSSVLSQPPAGALQLNEDAVTSAPFEWIDNSAPEGRVLMYWVEWRSGGHSTYVGPAVVQTAGSAVSLPAAFTSVSPNPGRSGASFGIRQSAAGTAEVVLYNVAGREVVRLPAGVRRATSGHSVDYTLDWNGIDEHGNRVASGVYLARLLFNRNPVEGQREGVTIVR